MYKSDIQTHWKETDKLLILICFSKLGNFINNFVLEFVVRLKKLTKFIRHEKFIKLL